MDQAESSSSTRAVDLVDTVKKMLAEVPKQSGKCCMYRVPKRLRSLNPEAHTPMAVPIGPIHHKVHGEDSSQVDDPDLLNNRLDKLRYLGSFLQHLESLPKDKKSAEAAYTKFYLEPVMLGKSEIDEFYAYLEKIFRENDEIFMEMILLDSIFIIQLFREHSKDWRGENWLGSDKNLCELNNSMGIHAYHFRGGYLYQRIAKELNIYHKKKWKRYNAILMQKYLGHPWAIVGLFSAGVLLLLTIAQVVLASIALRLQIKAPG